jgi:hypothetical protein
MSRTLQRTCLVAMMIAAMGLTTRVMAAAAPTVTGITPSMADVLGGERVEIAGTNFNNGAATAVLFGTTNAPTFTIVSDTLISVIVPAHPAKGCVTISVTNATGTGVSAAEIFTYTTHNRVLQVSVRMTLGKSARIAWDAATDTDDLDTAPKGGANVHAGGNTDIDAYIWYVRDCEFGMPPTAAAVNLGGVYSTDGAGGVFAPGDPDNAHSLVIQNLSLTNSDINIDAVASNSISSKGNVAVNWANTGAAGPDTFLLRANLTGGAGTSTGSVVVPTGPATSLMTALPANGTPTLHLEVSTPTATLDVTPFATQTVTVSLIASAP